MLRLNTMLLMPYSDSLTIDTSICTTSMTQIRTVCALKPGTTNITAATKKRMAMSSQKYVGNIPIPIVLNVINSINRAVRM